MKYQFLVSILYIPEIGGIVSKKCVNNNKIEKIDPKIVTNVDIIIQFLMLL